MSRPLGSNPLDLIAETVPLDMFGVSFSEPVFQDTISDLSNDGSGYAMTNAFSSIKQTILTESFYYLAWADSLFTTGQFSSTNVIQQWFAPKWNPAGSDAYSNFICEYKNNVVSTSV